LFTVTKILQSKPGDDAALMELLDKYGPVVVSIDSSSWIFENYHKGIFASPKMSSSVCDPDNLGKF
jgi:hypothetical protein